MVAETFVEMDEEVQALPANYGEYYSNTDWRAQRIDERRLMALYTTSGANASTGLALYEEAVRTSDVVPQGYLTVTKDDERVILLHRPMVFAASRAQDARGWEDQVLMFVGDVCGNQLPPHVALPKQLMAIQTHKAKVAKWGECVLHCATSDTELMEAVPEDAPPTMHDEVSVRKGAYVPPSLLTMFLGGFSTIQHAIVAVDARLTEMEASVDDYLPLIDWLRVAATTGARTTVERSTNPAGPLGDTALTKKLVDRVKRDLPNWSVGPSARENRAENPSDQGLRDLLAEVLLQRNSGAQAAATSARENRKNPSEVWKGTIRLLCDLTQVDGEDDLPPIWEELANVDKREHQRVLEQAMKRMGRQLQMTPPVVTHELAATIVRLAFVSPNEDRLERGLQPFATLYANAKTVSELQDAIDSQTLILDGVGAPQLKDVLELKKASEKLHLPLKEKQVQKTIEAFAVTLGVLCGTASGLFRAFRKEVVVDFNRIADALEGEASRRPRELPYAQYLRWIQLRLHNYWTDCEEGRGRVDPPSFYRLHDAILHREWNAPALPDHLLKREATPTDGGRGGGEPAAPAGGKRKMQGDPDEAKGTFVKHPRPNEVLTARKDAVGKIATFLAMAAAGDEKLIPPKHADGKPICLSFQLRGSCYSDCARAKHGHRALSEDEVEKVSEWIEKSLAKRAREGASGESPP